MRRPAADDRGLPLGGEGPSVESLVEDYVELVWAIVNRIAGEQRADEAFQETWLAVAESIRGGKKVRSPRAWVAEIARNAARDAARRPVPLPLGADRIAPPAEDPVEAAEERAVLRRALDGIDEEGKEILLRWQLEGVPLRQIAADCGWSLGRVWNRLQKTLEQLRRALGPGLSPDL